MCKKYTIYKSIVLYILYNYCGIVYSQYYFPYIYSIKMSIRRNPYIPLFLHRENQLILWDIIHQSPLWTPFSRVLTASSMTPEKWFQQMIEKEYSSLLQAKIDDISADPVVWIRETNKSAIQRMVRYMSSRVYATTPTSASIAEGVPGRPISAYDTSRFSNSSVAYANTTLSTGYVNETPALVYSAPRNYDTPHITAFDVERERKEKQDKAKREFESYQTQYNSLLTTNTPTAPVFSENIQMEKITNMDELLKQQQEAREHDARIVSSTPLPAPQSVGMSNEFVDRNHIRKEVENVFLQNNNQESLGAFKKQVSWDSVRTP